MNQLRLDGSEEAPPPRRWRPSEEPALRPTQGLLFDPSRQGERREIEEEAQFPMLLE